MPEDDNRVQIIHGDAFDELDKMDAESVHAIVTDPPYGLNFMGKDWDNFRRRNNEDDVSRDNVGGRLSAKAPASGAETEGKRYQEWCEKWARKALRVLKPGGHMLAFSGNRTHHRLFTGVEDAGFEIRDTLTWHYGSGFPKGQNVGKAIDKRAGEEREVGEKYMRPDGTDRDYDNYDDSQNVYTESRNDSNESRRKTIPATEEAERWDGWNTQLKPATEFVVLARSPLSEGTVAENVLEHGTGALHIDGCRLSPGDGGDRDGEDSRIKRYTDEGGTNIAARPGPRGGSSDGRYPANLALDEIAAEQLDAQSGDLPGGTVDFSESVDNNNQAIYGAFSGGENRTESYQYDDDGGASRFFYTAKASRRERTHGGRVENSHPTVKPVDLIEWLVRLVSAEDQTVLDPFLGSGTTAVACLHEYRKCLGIEADADSVETARDRVRVTRERNPTEEGERLTDYMTATDGGDEG